MSGSDLMIRFAQGDDAAFVSLLDRYEKELLNFFYRLCGERHAAEDMTQDLFMKVYSYRDRYTPSASLRVFLYRIARNMWIDRLRKIKVRPKVFSLDQGADGKNREDGKAVALDIRPGTEPTPQERAVQAEQTRRLGRALLRLPAKQREVLVLSFQEGLRYAEISEILEIPVGTVKSRVHGAMERLRILMGEGDAK